MKFVLLVWLGALAVIGFVILRRTRPHIRNMLCRTVPKNSKSGKEDPSRIQHFLTAVGMAIAYAVMTLHDMSTSDQPLTSLPDIPEVFLVLLGSSSGIYVANKYLKKQ